MNVHTRIMGALKDLEAVGSGNSVLDVWNNAISDYEFTCSEIDDERIAWEDEQFDIDDFFEEELGQVIFTNNENINWWDNGVDTSHYDVFVLPLTAEQIVAKEVRVDPYQVSDVWSLGTKDPSGCLFHMLKNIARISTKEGNSVEREIAGLEATLKRFKQLQTKKFVSK